MTDPQVLDTPASPAVKPEEAQPKPRDGRALSAYRHGITGQIVLFTEQEQLAYAEHCRGYFKDLAPEGYVQQNLVQLIADDRWREEAGKKLESAIVAAQITQPDTMTTGDPEIDTVLAQGRAWIEKGNSIALLSLYENRIQRRIEKNMAELRTLKAEMRAAKAEREAKLEQALEDARVLCERAHKRNEEFEPHIREAFADFDFSLEEAVDRLARYRTLYDARDRFGSPKRPLRRAA